jgi:uncharacterized membrane protein YagU involved in acid resistance
MATAAVQGTQAVSASLVSSIVQGVTAGLIGGSVFGVMIGSQSPVVGFILHLAISAFIGGVYGVVASRLRAGWLISMGAGIVNGVVWWVAGALIIMPLALGMSEMIFQIGDMQWMSLIGHVIFGIVTAGFFALIQNRQSE